MNNTPTNNDTQQDEDESKSFESAHTISSPDMRVAGSDESGQSLPMRFSHPINLMTKLRDALNTVQNQTMNIMEISKRKSVETLNTARVFLSNLIRRDHDTLEVDSAIAQHMIDKLTYRVNALLIASSWLGIGASLYNIVTGVFVVIGDSGDSELWERAVIAIPPAVISAIVTAIVIYLQQLQIVDRLKELTNVKTDTDYVISKLEPMYNLAERADSIKELDNIDLAFRGETSALKQKARRAISKVIKKEDRAVHLRKYRYLMLQELYAKQEHEHIRDLIIRYQEMGLELTDVAPLVEKYGMFGSLGTE